MFRSLATTAQPHSGIFLLHHAAPATAAELLIHLIYSCWMCSSPLCQRPL